MHHVQFEHNTVTMLHYVEIIIENSSQISSRKTLSSFMCKNILLLCIRSTHPSEWCPQNLLSVFTFVLLQLKRSIIQEHCPHFIIHENNLMAQKFTPQVKNWLLEKIQFIYETQGHAFLDIEIDDIGNRFQTQLNTPRHCIIVRDILHDQAGYISVGFFNNLARKVSGNHRFLLQSIISGKNGIITTLVQLNHHGSDLEQTASRLLTPLICSSLGSVIASRDIYNNHSVSPEARTWLLLGQNSDVASSGLKLASLFTYCVGDFHTTETILGNIADMYDQGLVAAVCCCNRQGGLSHSKRFDDYCNTYNELSIKQSVAYCVRFIPEEVHCQPTQLQYEMFRSTQDDQEQRDRTSDLWMDWAVVDSLPYLYFLQYKTYCNLQQYDEQQQALNNLVRSIHTTSNIGHKETALNLLGQIYQQENRQRHYTAMWLPFGSDQETTPPGSTYVYFYMPYTQTPNPCSDMNTVISLHFMFV